MRQKGDEKLLKAANFLEFSLFPHPLHSLLLSPLLPILNLISSLNPPSFHPPLMRFQLFSTLLPLVGLALATSPNELAQRSSGPTCKTFKVPITASAKNKVFNIAADADDLQGGIGSVLNSVLSQVETGLGNLLGGLILTSGTYKINMKYCTPEVTVASRKNTVQFLVPPGSYRPWSTCRSTVVSHSPFD